jgi:protein-disulfide isomerase
VAALAAVNLFNAGCAFSQNSPEVQALKNEVEALKKDQQAMQKDLEEIKSFLQERAGMRPQPKNLELSVDGSPYMGDKNAKVTVIEFSDYQCPFCARHFTATLPQLVSDYVKTGKVKYVLRDFPLQGLHPAALRAAEAAHCAGEQGKYWEMHDRLLNSQRALGEKELPEYAKAVGVDVSKFEQCVSSGKYESQVRRDEEEAKKAGVSGTPSFFLGLTQQNETKIKAAKMLVGAQPYPSFKEAIDGLLTSP